MNFIIYPRDNSKRNDSFYPRVHMVLPNYAYWITVNYREAYKMYACNGIYLIMRVVAGVKLLLPEK